MRHHYIPILLGIVLSATASADAAPRDSTPPWNVLFIAADDLRCDLGCYGHPLVKTPHFDRLAKRSISFNRAYCQQALCNPSRASVLTGRRPDTLGIWDLPTHFREVDPNVVTLPQHFKNNGYFTQNIGKVFHNWRQEIQGDPKSWSVPAVMHFATHGSDKAQLTQANLPPDLTKFGRTECRDVPDEAYFDGRIAAKAVAALRELKDRDQPFFLGVGFWKPHLPFNPPKRYWDLYDRAAISKADNPDPPKDAPDIAFHNGRELLGPNGRELTDAEIIELRHGYLAGISYLDAQLGKLLDTLDQLELTDRTIIVFWSDHGFHLGEHGLWCKTSNYELDARVPMFISVPGMKSSGSSTDALVELLDLYPTLIELCQLPRVEKLDGVSLRPVLADPSARVKSAAYTQHPRPAYYQDRPEVMGVSARTDRFRYTEWRRFETGEVVARELYDHRTDPDENQNVIASPPATDEFQQAVALLEDVFPRKVGVSPHRLQHGVPGLTVDLGVGLWAWPIPMDWDGDGKIDLVVSCPDTPFEGTYFFKNTGDDPKMPTFEPPVRVGPKLPNVGVSYVDGEPRVLVPGSELIDFRAHGFTKRQKIHDQTNIHPNRVRANQWRYVDFNGNGVLDLAVGVGDWTEYGWDDAFDKSGKWTRGPLRGYVTILINEGTNDRPRYAEPYKLQAGDKPIDVFGMPSPNFADFDGDGDLDLICGEFLDGFTYFQNVGTRAKPRYAPGVRLTHDGKPLAMDLQMIVPVAIDWDDDGDVDLIVGDEDGRVALVENTGKLVEGVPVFLPPRYFRQQATDVKFGALVTPWSVDWDGDGHEDLICGNTAGQIGFIKNLGGGYPPRFAEPVLLEADGKPIRIQAGTNGSIQGPAEAKWGYTTLSVADWNNNGLPDIIVNSIWGRIEWFENVGTRREPKLTAAKPIRVAWKGNPPKPAWNWWDPRPGELVTQWRTTPIAIDLDKDGLIDLVMLDHEGYLTYFQRERREDGELVLKPGERIFRDEKGQPLRLNDQSAGKSGRRKLCLADWNGNGKLDLLVNSQNVDLWQNISTPERPWTFKHVGPLDERKLAGHTTSPTVVDWNQNGRPDLLIGAEDGRFYYRPNRD